MSEPSPYVLSQNIFFTNTNSFYGSTSLILICHHIVSVFLVKFYENDGAKFVMTVVHVSSIWVDMICYLFYNCLILRIFTTFPKDVGGGVVNTKFLLNDVNFSGLGGAKIWYIFSKMCLRHTKLRSTYSPQQRLLQGKNPARPCQASRAWTL